MDSILLIKFDTIERFENGRGLMIPGREKNDDFHTLRQKVLSGTQEINPYYKPHITLMHPGNSTCSDRIFNQVKKLPFPAAIDFDTISMIEQWRTLENSQAVYCFSKERLTSNYFLKLFFLFCPDLKIHLSFVFNN